MLALEAVFHRVLVHHRYDEELDIVAQPAAGGVVGKNGLDEALELVACHHFASVMPRGQGYAMWRSAGQFTGAKQLDVSSAVAAAQRLHLEMRILADALDERVQILFVVRHADREKQLGRVGGERVGKARAALHAFGADP